MLVHQRSRFRENFFTAGWLLVCILHFSASDVEGLDFDSTYLGLEAGGSVQWVTTGDFDSDAILDVASANMGSNGVSIFWGRDRFAGVRSDLSLVSDARALAAGDFDGDTRQDLAVIHSMGPALHITVLLGNGAGSFALGTTLEVVNPFERNFGNLVAADFDRDGHLDLAAASGPSIEIAGRTAILVWLGDGNGGFGPPSQTGVNRWAIFVASADFDADGGADLVVGSSAGSSLHVLIGYRDGDFMTQRSVLPCRWGSRFVALADLDGDGHVDIAAATETNVTILRARGGGSFEPARILDTRGTPANPLSLAASDLDADEHPELFAAWDDGTFSIYPGTSTGPRRRAGDFVAPPGAKAMIVADLDADTRPDVVLAAGTVAILQGNGDGSFGTGTRIPTDHPPLDFETGDIDRDGMLDLVTAHRHPTSHRSGRILVHPGAGGRKFGHSVETIVPDGPANIAIGDVDGDGTLDLVAVGPDFRRFLRGRGDGTFEVGDSYPEGIVRHLRLVDFDQDGALDLLTAAATVSVRRGTGDGNFEAAVVVGVKPGNTVSSLEIVDLDGDGLPDIAASYGSSYFMGGFPGGIGLIRSRSDGSFEPQAIHEIGGWSGQAMTLGHFDQDAFRDVVMIQYVPREHGATFRRVALMGSGPLAFQPSRELPGGWAVALDSRDLDFDGLEDLIELRSAVRVSKGRGDGTFEPNAEHGLGVVPTQFAIADMDGDGHEDLVGVNRASSDLTILWNRAGGTRWSMVERRATGSSLWLDPLYEAPSGNPIRIRYGIDVVDSDVRLEVFDVRGRLVRRIRPHPGSGPQIYEWDRLADSGHRVPRGVYVVRLGTSREFVSKKARFLLR